MSDTDKQVFIERVLSHFNHYNKSVAGESSSDAEPAYSDVEQFIYVNNIDVSRPESFFRVTEGLERKSQE